MMFMGARIIAGLYFLARCVCKLATDCTNDLKDHSKDLYQCFLTCVISVINTRMYEQTCVSSISSHLFYLKPFYIYKIHDFLFQL